MNNVSGLGGTEVEQTEPPASAAGLGGEDAGRTQPGGVVKRLRLTASAVTILLTGSFLLFLAPLVWSAKNPTLMLMPDLWRALFVAATLSGLAAECLILVRGYRWLRAQFIPRQNSGIPDAVAQVPRNATLWLWRTLDVLGILALVALVGCELLFGFLVFIFVGADFSMAWGPDGSVWWYQQAWLDRGCNFHRQVNVFVVDKESLYSSTCMLTDLGK